MKKFLLFLFLSISLVSYCQMWKPDKIKANEISLSDTTIVSWGDLKRLLNVPVDEDTVVFPELNGVVYDIDTTSVTLSFTLSENAYVFYTIYKVGSTPYVYDSIYVDTYTKQLIFNDLLSSSDYIIKMYPKDLQDNIGSSVVLNFRTLDIEERQYYLVSYDTSIVSSNIASDYIFTCNYSVIDNAILNLNDEDYSTSARSYYNDFPYFSLDLENSYYIDSIILTGCSSYANVNYFFVMLNNDGFSGTMDNMLGQYDFGQQYTGSSLGDNQSIVYMPNSSFRYLMIRKNSASTYLGFSEIEVWARDTLITISDTSINISYVKQNPSIQGGSDGFIDIMVDGGTPPYSFLWSNSETTEDVFLLSSGYYSVTVSDTYTSEFLEGIHLTDPLEISDNGEFDFSDSSVLPVGYNYYYVSSSCWDGSGSGTELDPWNFVEAQSNMSSLGENDALLFKRNDIFHGQLNINNEGGSYSQPFYIGSYGVGDLPVFTGEYTYILSSNGTNLYSANVGVQPYIVTVNGVLYDVNKYPTSDLYLGVYFNSSSDIPFTSGISDIVANEFVNDQVLVRWEPWYYAKKIVGSHSDKLYLDNYYTKDGLGWGHDGYVKYYNSDNSKAFENGTYYYKDGLLVIYSTDNLSGQTVKVCGLSYGINFISQSNNVSINDIDFRYYKDAGIHFLNENVTNRNIDFNQCNFEFIEGNGIEKTTPYVPVPADSSYSVTYCKFKYITEVGISMESVFNTNISNNFFSRIAWNEFYPNTTYGTGSAMAFVTAQNLLINRNRIDSSGCSAIQNTLRDDQVNSNIIIEENWISNSVSNISDMGSIYTYNTSLSQDDDNVLDSLVIRDNFIEKAYGAHYVMKLNADMAHLIYTDEGSFNHVIHDNLLAHGQQLYFGNQAPHIGEGYNYIFNNYFLDYEHALEPQTYQDKYNVDTLFVYDNVFIKYRFSDYNFFIGDAYRYNNELKVFNNTYIDKFSTGYCSAVDLYGWWYGSGDDADWSDPPITYFDWGNNYEVDMDYRNVSTNYSIDDYIFYKYNFSNTILNYNLPSGVFEDINGIEYSGTVTIQPYRFVVLFKQ